MELHKVEIRNKEYPVGPGPKVFKGLEILIDGEPLKACHRATLQMDAGDVVRLRVETFPSEIDISLEGVSFEESGRDPL